MGEEVESFEVVATRLGDAASLVDHPRSWPEVEPTQENPEVPEPEELEEPKELDAQGDKPPKSS